MINKKRDIKQKICDLEEELKHMENVEVEEAIDIGVGDYFEEISEYINDLKNQISSLKEDLTKIEKGEIEMKRIEITNINEIKEFIKEHDSLDFDGFVSNFNLNKLLLIGWNDEIEIKLNVDFTSFKFLNFIKLIYMPLKKGLPQYSTRKKFWLVD